MGEQFADVNIVDRVARGGGGVTTACSCSCQYPATAIEEEWTNILQATINNSMRRRCVALREAHSGHTRY